MPEIFEVFEVEIGKTVRLKHEHFFDYHQYGSNLGIPDGRIEIQRGSDGQYWNGSTWVASQTWNATTVDGGGLFDSYDFQVPADAAIEILNVRMQHNDDPDTEARFSMTPKGGASLGFD